MGYGQGNVMRGCTLVGGSIDRLVARDAEAELKAQRQCVGDQPEPAKCQPPAPIVISIRRLNAANRDLAEAIARVQGVVDRAFDHCSSVGSTNERESDRVMSIGLLSMELERAVDMTARLVAELTHQTSRAETVA